MAIARDMAGSQPEIPVFGSGQCTINITVGTLTNGILYVAGYGPHTVNSMTYGGHAMTKIAVYSVSPENESLFALANPPAGTNALVANWSGIYFYSFFCYQSWSGASQTISTNYAAASTSGTPFNTTLTTLIPGSWIGQMEFDSNGISSSYSSGSQTVTANGVNAADTDGPITPAGSFTFTQSGGAGATLSGIAFEIPPAAASGPTRHIRGGGRTRNYPGR